MEIKTSDEGQRHKREMLIDGETVAHLWVIDYTMRIGIGEVRMAGIGDVYTQRKHRMKGYMRHLFGDTVTYMTQEGYDVSMLFGIPNFYNKFGYATCLPNFRFAVKTRDAEAARDHAEPMPSRPIELEDMEAVVALYNAKNATRTGTLVRNAETFTKFPHGTHWDAEALTALWEDVEGNLLAYAVWDRRRTEVKVAELEAQDSTLFPTLLAFFAEQAVEKRCEAITFDMPPDHPFSEYVQRYGTVWTIAYPRYADGMMRILNQQPLFEKLVPVFEHRLALPRAAGLLGSLTIETELGTTSLTFSEGKVKIARGGANPERISLPQDGLIQLLMGYRSLRDVMNSPEVTVEGDALPMLDRLFPKDEPFVWKPDHF